MTALREYRRLEALGLWRDGADAQRREVVVSLGDASLVMSSASGEALGHWSLPAVERLNPGTVPALYSPDPESTEELELAEPEMIAAIERIRTAIERKRPHPGRLRLALAAGALTFVVALAALWLPGALTRQTVALLPDAKQVDIGEQLLGEITSLAGRPCAEAAGQLALSQLAARLFGAEAAPRLVVLPATIPDTLSLPGGIMVVSADLAEDYESPDVLAGYLLAEEIRHADQGPVELLLSEAGLSATFRLLTTGDVAPEVIHDHAARLLSRRGAAVEDAALLRRFAEARIPSRPYAYARDVSGETTIALIEADPMRADQAGPILDDADWVSLQEICSG